MGVSIIDAMGNKMKKVTIDKTDAQRVVTTTTLYLGGLVYGIETDPIDATKSIATAPGDVVAGQKLNLDNVYTESIRNSTSQLTTDVFLIYHGSTAQGPQGTVEDYYNCWGSAIAGTEGREIKNGVGYDEGSFFDAVLKTSYKPADVGDAKFGQTVIRFEKNGEVQHGAVFYGKSQDGTTYVYTKNGWSIKPEVMKLSTLQQKLPEYGTVQGIKPGESGYYNHK